MSRPVRFNLIQKDSSDLGINQVQLPEGHMGEGFLLLPGQGGGFGKEEFHVATAFRNLMLWY